MKYNKIPELSEHDQQCSIFRWADLMSRKYPELWLLHAIPNGGLRHKATARRLKDEGVKSGVPDMCLPVARNGFHGLYIELKKKSDSSVTVNQDEWLSRLSEQKYLAIVCRGEDSVKQLLINYLEGKINEGLNGRHRTTDIIRRIVTVLNEIEKHPNYMKGHHHIQLVPDKYIRGDTGEVKTEGFCNCGDNKAGELISGWYCPVHGKCF